MVEGLNFVSPSQNFFPTQLKSRKEYFVYLGFNVPLQLDIVMSVAFGSEKEKGRDVLHSIAYCMRNGKSSHILLHDLDLESKLFLLA